MSLCPETTPDGRLESNDTAKASDSTFGENILSRDVLGRRALLGKDVRDLVAPGRPSIALHRSRPSSVEF